MRVIVGAVAVLGLAVTVAAAQPVKERAATLMAPQALAPGDLPPVARGAADDFPGSLSSTPVPRSNSPAARASTPAGPAWLSGVDPNVLPAAGSSAKSGAVRPLTPPPMALGKDDAFVPPPPPKMLDRLKIFPGDKQPAPQPLPQPVVPVQQAQPQQPTAATPFRGTGANGAPVFAGPPAYRWYGWGSVTPGANPLAPAGHYPKASANWYSITGATPGAFPVPVSNPGRIVPGTEPPTYGLAAPPVAPAPVVPIGSQPQPAPQFADRPEAPRFGAESKFLPGTNVSAGSPPAFAPPTVPAPVSVPTLTPPPGPKPAAAVATPGPQPAMHTPPAAVVAPAPVVPAPVVPPPTVPRSEPIASLPPMPPVPALPPVSAVPSVTPVPSVEPAKPALEPRSISAAPAPLPTSVTADPPREELKWQQSTDPAPPRPGTWAPAAGPAPLPTVPVDPAPSWQTGHAKVAPVVRAQMPDNTPDPIAALIKQVRQGRAENVEVRWTGTKKVQACFEVRSSDAAQKLVADISKRPELNEYQIDFCVVVK